MIVSLGDSLLLHNIKQKIDKIFHETANWLFKTYALAASCRRCLAKSQKKCDASSYLFNATAFIASVLSTRSASSKHPAS